MMKTIKWPALMALGLLASCAGSTPTRPDDGSNASKSLVISKGAAFAKSDYVIPGHVVILDFTADW